VLIETLSGVEQLTGSGADDMAERLSAKIEFSPLTADLCCKQIAIYYF